LPNLRKNAAYLQEKGIDLYRGIGPNAPKIDSTKVNWKNIGWGELSQMRMRQPPGVDNPLGQFRVLMTNPYNVYLHDTNHRDLFGKDKKTLSSGCIRLAEPLKMAHFIMRGHPEWSPAKEQAILASGNLTNIRTAERMPIQVIYQTAWLDGKGRLVLGRDVYRRDRKVLDAIDAIYNRPENVPSNDARYAMIVYKQ